MDNNKVNILSNIELFDLLRNTWIAVSRLLDLELSQINLTLEQATVLRFLLEKNGAITTEDLNDSLKRHPHSISVLTNRMARMGLLKIDMKSDENRHQISLTKKGKALLDQVNYVALDLLFSSIKTREKRQFARCLYRLHQKAGNLLVISNNIVIFLQYIANNYKDTSNNGKLTNLKVKMSNQELWTLLDHTIFAIGRLRQLELYHLGVTMEQSAILRIANNGGSTTAKVIARETMRQEASVRLLIKRMVKSGLVRKNRILGERSFTISLTKDGETLYNKITYYAYEIVFSTLTAKQKEQLAYCFVSLLTKARDLLNRSNKLMLLLE